MKKKIIFGVVLLLIIVWAIYDIFHDKQEENFVDVISYLENKYEQEFEILNETSRQYETSSLIIDGSVFWKSRKVKDKYEYDYEILSVSDDVKFKVYQLSHRGKNRFEDSYKIEKNADTLLNEISNYIIDRAGNSNTTYQISRSEPFNDYSLSYDSQIVINMKENLDELYNENYIKKLYQIQSYVDEKLQDINSSNINGASMKVDIFLEYLNNKTIRLGYLGPSVNEFKTDGGLLSKEDLEKINVSLEDYKEKLQK